MFRGIPYSNAPCFLKFPFVASVIDNLLALSLRCDASFGKPNSFSTVFCSAGRTCNPKQKYIPGRMIFQHHFYQFFQLHLTAFRALDVIILLK